MVNIDLLPNSCLQQAASMAAYSRDMARSADEGGQILTAASGYDPR